MEKRCAVWGSATYCGLMRNDFLDLRRQAKRITADPIVATDAKKAHAKKATATAKSSAKAEVTLTQILDTAPSLRSGQKQPLGDIVQDLYNAKLIGKNAVSTKLFKKFLDQCELTPEKQPNQVRYLAS